MINEQEIIDFIYNVVFKKDVDYSINIFLCGAETGKKKSIRTLLNIELQKDLKFNAVLPEYIFASLLGNRNYNLLELEDDLAKSVDVIVLPLEGQGTLCELGAFTMNKELLPKIIVVNNEKFKNKKSFINLGPLDLIKKNNEKNIIYYTEGDEADVIPDLIKIIKNKRKDKMNSYDLDNLFNLSRFIFYIVAVFQPITKGKVSWLISKVENFKIKSKYIDSAFQILVQKNRIEFDIESVSLKEFYKLSRTGHSYFYETAVSKLNIKNDFAKIRSLLINSNYSRKQYKSKDEKLLV